MHLDQAFKEAGWAAMMAPKAMPQQTGAEVAKRVVEGKAEFGLTLSGEVASVPGAVIAGPLPAPFGQDTVYCAAVMTASAANGRCRGLHRGADPARNPRRRGSKAGFELP